MLGIMTIKKVRNILRAEMFCSLCLMAVIIGLYENEVLLPGFIEENSMAEFILLTAMELLTVCTVPLAMRLFKFSFVNRAIDSMPEQGLLFWGTIRMLLVCIPVVFNMLFYYLTSLKVAFFYMAVIGIICLIFINPTMRRCLAETRK